MDLTLKGSHNDCMKLHGPRGPTEDRLTICEAWSPPTPEYNF